MQIQARNDFAADTVTTHAMLTDPAFLTAVCVASGDLAYRVDGVPERTAVERRLESPSAVRGLLGDTLTLLQDIRWNPAGPDGGRTGRLELTVQGMPARAELAIDLRPGGRGTQVDFTGEFTIKVPLVGRSLEGKAVPALTAGFDVQQQVGDDWLAGRRGQN
ncbi:MAG: DUF2505 domain-containing protein [Micropruina sp.]|uniref:DUF2505 domain-containing protein n=1 Tax=Micropruina sp. TaxID=2737536 RepID=UPI0039E2A679